MVMAHIDGIVMATETAEDYMIRLMEVFIVCATHASKLLYEVGNKVPGTCTLRRRYQTGSLSNADTARLGSTQEQNGTANLFGLRQLLSRVCSLTCQACGPIACYYQPMCDIRLEISSSKFSIPSS